jgi:hypothetical protein
MDWKDSFPEPKFSDALLFQRNYEIDTMILRAHERGASFREIADHLKCSQSRIWQRAMKAKHNSHLANRTKTGSPVERLLFRPYEIEKRDAKILAFYAGWLSDCLASSRPAD